MILITSLVSGFGVSVDALSGLNVYCHYDTYHKAPRATKSNTNTNLKRITLESQVSTEPNQYCNTFPTTPRTESRTERTKIATIDNTPAHQLPRSSDKLHLVTPRQLWQPHIRLMPILRVASYLATKSRKRSAESDTVCGVSEKPNQHSWA